MSLGTNYTLPCFSFSLSLYLSFPLFLSTNYEWVNEWNWMVSLDNVIHSYICMYSCYKWLLIYTFINNTTHLHSYGWNCTIFFGILIVTLRFLIWLLGRCFAWVHWALQTSSFASSFFLCGWIKHVLPYWTWKGTIYTFIFLCFHFLQLINFSFLKMRLTQYIYIYNYRASGISTLYGTAQQRISIAWTIQKALVNFQV